MRTDKRIRPTQAEHRVLKTIDALIDSNDLVPTHQELADTLSVSRATITIHITALISKGYLRRSRRWRDMDILTEAEWEMAKHSDRRSAKEWD